MINKNIFLYILIPFSAFGFYLNNYFISFLTIAIGFYVILELCGQSKFTKKPLVALGLFLFISIISSIGLDPEEYFPQLFIVTIFLLALSLKHSFLNYKLFIFSYTIIAIYAFFELIFNFINPDIMVKLSDFMGQRGGVNLENGYTKLRAGFLEPSVFSIILVYYFIGFSHLEKQIKLNKIYKISTVLFILLTMASSGYVILLLIGLVILIRKILINRSNSAKIFLMAIALFWIYIYRQGDGILLDYGVIEKIYNIAPSIAFQNISGSTGYRANSIILAYQFVQEAEWLQKLFGMGFFNYGEYIINKYIVYPGFEMSGFSKGFPGNVHTAILLSCGLIGYVFFILFFWFVSNCRSFFNQFILFLTIMMTFFAFGSLVDPLFFSVFLITRAVLNTYRDDQVECDRSAKTIDSGIYNSRAPLMRTM